MFSFRKPRAKIINMPLLRFLISIAFVLKVAAAVGQKFPDAGELPPVGYKGKVFQLSQDFPSSLILEKEQPWMKIDYKKEPLKYVLTVYEYILAGNAECDWVVQNNKVRKWYHVPWMHWNDPKDGLISREFINGLTRERDSKPNELSPLQYDFKQNWAIGFYNSAGGYTIGQVWKDPNNPDPGKARFPIGTVCGKLLFTETDTITAPYLKFAPVCNANIHVSVNEKNKKAIKQMRLLQFDIAVRDPRANNETGWVFGTLIYDGNSPSPNPWLRMVPAGAMWGNDVGITPDNVANGKKLNESFVNPVVRHKFKFGWAGRLNGPVDNPSSSCVSCHSTAQYPMLSSQSPSDNATAAERLHWFRKQVKSGETFTIGAASLDYSMQLAIGIEHFYLYKIINHVDTSSAIWKKRLLRFIEGGYIYIFILILLSFFIISKKASAQFRLNPFLNMDLLVLILRLGIGAMFMVHGFSKISGGPATWMRLGQTVANMGIYFYPQWWGFIAAFAEFGGGFLMLSGLFFRPATFMMIIQMTVAFVKHKTSGDSIETASHAIELWFVCLFLFMIGPGKFSIDSKIFGINKTINKTG